MESKYRKMKICSNFVSFVYKSRNDGGKNACTYITQNNRISYLLIKYCNPSI